MSKKLLLLIDCQNDFITGALGNPESEKIVPKIVEKIKSHDGEIIATHDTHFNKIQVESNWPPMGGKPYEETLESQYCCIPHCIKLTEGYEIEPSILAACHEKNGKNGPTKFFGVDKYTFGWDGWKKYLETFKFDEIEIVGFCSILENATILRSIFPDMKITIDTNCVGGYTDECRAATMKCLEIQNIEIV